MYAYEYICVYRHMTCSVFLCAGDIATVCGYYCGQEPWCGNKALAAIHDLGQVPCLSLSGSGSVVSPRPGLLRRSLTQIHKRCSSYNGDVPILGFTPLPRPLLNCGCSSSDCFKTVLLNLLVQTAPFSNTRASGSAREGAMRFGVVLKSARTPARPH